MNEFFVLTMGSPILIGAGIFLIYFGIKIIEGGIKGIKELNKEKKKQ